MKSSLAASFVVSIGLALAGTRGVRAADPLPEIEQPETNVRLAMIPPQPIPLPPIDDPTGGDLLSLDAAEQLALDLNPAVREAEAHVRAARGKWLQVGLRPNPALGYSGEEIGDEGTAGKQGGFVSQEVVTSGKLRWNRAVASREISRREQELARTELQTITNVRIQYFEALAAQRAMELAKQLGAMADQAVRASELRLKAMEGSRASLLQSEIERDSANLLEEQAANRQAAAWRRLAAAIGWDESAPRPLADRLSDPLPPLEWQPSYDRLMAESPELAELHFAVEQARMTVHRATAGRVPNVNLQAGVQYDNAVDNTIANVQVSVPLPVFDRNQGAIAEACGELAAAQAAVDRRQLELQQRLAATLRDYDTARQRVTKYTESILPAALESLDMINHAYEQGELDYLQLLTAQRLYTEKSLAYLRDLETAWKKWAEIDGLLVTQSPPSSD